jgi:dienelactone hydrolase
MEKKMKTLILIVSIFLFGIIGCASQPQTPVATFTLEPTTPPPTETPEPTNTPEPTFTPDPDFEPLAQLFDYDKNADLKVIWGTEIQEEDIIFHQLNFAGADDCTVRSYFVTPQGNGPHPALIFLHMGSANKDQYLEEAKQFAGLGVVSILLDSPFRRRCVDDENVRQGYINTVIELRRAVDLLETLEFVDPAQIGFVGHSFGGTWGGVLAGVEPRIKAFVLIAGSSNISQLESPDDSDLDAVHYIGHSQAAFLFQFTTSDEWITLEDANQYFDAAYVHKQILWYDSTHRDLQYVGQADRLLWLAEQFGFDLPEEE